MLVRPGRLLQPLHLHPAAVLVLCWCRVIVCQSAGGAALLHCRLGSPGSLAPQGWIHQTITPHNCCHSPIQYNTVSE